MDFRRFEKWDGRGTTELQNYRTATAHADGHGEHQLPRMNCRGYYNGLALERRGQPLDREKNSAFLVTVDSDVQRGPPEAVSA